MTCPLKIMKGQFLLSLSGVGEGGTRVVGICGSGLPGICPPFLLGVFSQASLRCCGSQGLGRKHMAALQGLVNTDGVGRGQGSTRRQVTVAAVTTPGPGG